MDMSQPGPVNSHRVRKLNPDFLLNKACGWKMANVNVVFKRCSWLVFQIYTKLCLLPFNRNTLYWTDSDPVNRKQPFWPWNLDGERPRRMYCMNVIGWLYCMNVIKYKNKQKIVAYCHQPLKKNLEKIWKKMAVTSVSIRIFLLC